MKLQVKYCFDCCLKLCPFWVLCDNFKNSFIECNWYTVSCINLVLNLISFWLICRPMNHLSLWSLPIACTLLSQPMIALTLWISLYFQSFIHMEPYNMFSLLSGFFHLSYWFWDSAICCLCQRLILFYCWVVFCCMNICQFICPFTHW